RFEIMVVGEGSERQWLESNLAHGRLTGVLRNEALAEAYANLDLFIFPSTTDTFGNVVLEALASGVPVIVMNGGGPKFIVRDGLTGYIAANESRFADLVCDFVAHPERRLLMGEQARNAAMNVSWERVFEEVYRAYETAVNQHSRRQRETGRTRSHPL